MYKAFKIPPGLDRQTTSTSIGPVWYSANNMRFRDNWAETIGGWVRNGSYQLHGIGKGMHSWVTFEDDQFFCVGTTNKYYLIAGEAKFDITPNRSTITSLSGPITTDGSTGVVSVDTSGSGAHGASVGDFVVFTAVGSAVGGLNPEDFTEVYEGFKIISVPDSTTFTVDIGVNSSSATTGGGTVDLAFKIQSGTISVVTGSGYGVGAYGGDDYSPTEYSLNASPVDTLGSSNLSFDITGSGATFDTSDWIYVYGLSGTVGGVDTTLYNNKWWRYINVGTTTTSVFVTTGYPNTAAATGGGSSGKFYHYDNSAGSVVGATRGWGDASAESILTGFLREVSIHNFGEDLMIANRGGPIYYYDVSSKTSSGTPVNGEVAVELSTVTGSTECPVIVDSFFVNNSHGHCIALAVNDVGDTGQNKMLIRWSDRHNPFVWLPSQANEAGGHVLRHGSEILAGVQTKDESLIFTNGGIYAMRFVGFPDVYGFDLVTSNVFLYSRRGAIAVDDAVFFMANNSFYVYDGSVRPLPKNMANFLFDDVNESQKEKIFAASNSKFTEIYWFYPSKNSYEVDKWVSYNYANGTWSSGVFDMAAFSLNEASTTSYNRTAWEDARVFNSPMASYILSYDPATEPETLYSAIMNQESGTDGQGAAIPFSIESGKFEMDDADRYMFYDSLMPDLELFDLSDSVSDASLTLSVDGQNLPGRGEHKTSSVIVDFTSTSDAGLNYAPSYSGMGIRGRAKFISVKAESEKAGYGWRLGNVRLRLRPDGRR